MTKLEFTPGRRWEWPAERYKKLHGGFLGSLAAFISWFIVAVVAFEKVGEDFTTNFEANAAMFVIPILIFAITKSLPINAEAFLGPKPGRILDTNIKSCIGQHAFEDGAISLENV